MERRRFDLVGLVAAEQQGVGRGYECLEGAGLAPEFQEGIGVGADVTCKGLAASATAATTASATSAGSPPFTSAFLLKSSMNRLTSA